jgi:hypothetical protein
MYPSVTDHSVPVVPSIFEHVPRAATRARTAVRRRKTAFWAALLVAPATAGVVLGLTSRRRGLVAGGLAALALGALRWQFARWFTDEPAYESEGMIGDLELRRYPIRIEARAHIEATDFEAALGTGFRHLAAYIFGANDDEEELAMIAPVVTTMRDGSYSMSFVMPPDRPHASLPRPEDPRIEVHEAPEKRVAVLRFRGRFTRANVEAHERQLLRQLVDAGLATRGSVAFAGYDAPATLPFLRRNELWIEIV